jgi:hypothetical protein
MGPREMPMTTDTSPSYRITKADSVTANELVIIG